MKTIWYSIQESVVWRFVLFGVKENEQSDLIYNGIILKHSSHETILGVTIDNKLCFDEHVINICKTNKKLNALSSIRDCTLSI